jgi:hypothetical protein
VEIVVDELVVRGLAPAAACAAAAALETRLTALAARDSTAIAERAEAFHRAAPVSVAAGSPAAFGDAVAGAVWDTVAGRGAR